MGVVHLGNGTRTQECTSVHDKTLRMSFRNAGAVRQDELTLDEVRQFAGIGDEVTEATTCEKHSCVTTLVHNMAVVI